MKNNILVSIIIPIYNAETYLSECIESVLALENDQWELILINDGSTDSSDIICKKYSEKDSRILYVEQENAGVSVARNHGIKCANGEWLTFLDADDIISPKAISLIDFAKNNDDMIVANYTKKRKGFTLENTYQNMTAVELQKSILNLRAFKRIRKDITAINGYNRWSCWGRFYRAKIIKKYDILFPSGIKLGEDLLFCMKLSKKINNIIVNNSKIYYYRENENSVTKHFHKDRVINTIKLVNELKKYLIGELEKDFNIFVIDRISKCCVDYYGDNRNDLGEDELILKIKKFCSLEPFNKAILKCSYIYLLRGTFGKKNSVNNCFIVYFLRHKMYHTLMKYIEFSKKHSEA